MGMPEPKILTISSEGYEQSRRKYFNLRVPDAKPVEIWSPTTTSEVVAAIKSATRRNLKVGVRSGGHLFACNSLLGDGLLIDTKNLNKDFEYDSATKIVSFSPGHNVRELGPYLNSIQRFFPYGHVRDVGLGGFYLAGGQGYFVRGWGYTAETWVTQIEVVTASGEVVIANKSENTDLFWAAPGSGQGFFGVLTRLWCRTIRASKLFDKTILLSPKGIEKPLLKWGLQTAATVPKYGSDILLGTFYADKDAPDAGDFSSSNQIVFIINQTVRADTIDEAKVLASPWNVIPEKFQSHIIQEIPMTERTWDELWDLQDSLLPSGQRYRVDSMLTDTDVSLDEIIDKISPAIYQLPTRRASGVVALLDCIPDETDTALSLPSQICVQTLACWQNPAIDMDIDKKMLDLYREAEKVGRGQYIADYDEHHRVTKIMTDTALRKWLGIRKKWDPAETFVGHRGFQKSLDLPWKVETAAA